MFIPEMRGLTTETFFRAVRTYMGFAYESAEVPEIVRNRLVWPNTDSVSKLLECPQFERGNVSVTKSPVFALRLGNSLYPHMKLQLQPWPTSVGYMLSVNTHDQIAGLDSAAPDVAAFRVLQLENQRIKEAIEQAWEEQGLPTFLRYLKDYIALSQ